MDPKRLRTTALDVKPWNVIFADNLSQNKKSYVFRRVVNTLNWEKFRFEFFKVRERLLRA